MLGEYIESPEMIEEVEDTVEEGELPAIEDTGSVIRARSFKFRGRKGRSLGVDLSLAARGIPRYATESKGQNTPKDARP